MAEKSIRIAEQASGEYVAMRDAIEVDDGSHARIIERVDFASGKFATPMTTYTRGSGGLVTDIDTFDLTNLGSDLTGHLITVGDKSMLCVSVEQSVSGGTVTVTPILYDNEATPNIVGVLPPKTFTQPYAFRRGSGSGNYVLPIQTWDVSGAYKIGLHFSAETGTSNSYLAMGWVI